jgi:hypothetical protein
MTKRIDAGPDTPGRTISTEKVCFFIVKAREFHVKEANTDENSGSNASDDGMIDVLQDNGDDNVIQELASLIAAMSEDEQVDLVTLAWLGRDSNSLED